MYYKIFHLLVMNYDFHSLCAAIPFLLQLVVFLRHSGHSHLPFGMRVILRQFESISQLPLSHFIISPYSFSLQ